MFNVSGPPKRKFQVLPLVYDHITNDLPHAYVSSLNDNPDNGKFNFQRHLPKFNFPHDLPKFNFPANNAVAVDSVLYKASLSHRVRTWGEQLAYKYFGRNGKKGFRVVWKFGKGYYKIANKCHKYQHKLQPDCPQQYSLSLDSVTLCVIHIFNTSHASCPEVTTDYPPEATCEIDETVNPDDCAPI